jgi:hypothetical protein
MLGHTVGQNWTSSVATYRLLRLWTPSTTQRGQQGGVLPVKIPAWSVRLFWLWLWSFRLTNVPSLPSQGTAWLSMGAGSPPVVCPRPYPPCRPFRAQPNALLQNDVAVARLVVAWYEVSAVLRCCVDGDKVRWSTAHDVLMRCRRCHPRLTLCRVCKRHRGLIGNDITMHGRGTKSGKRTVRRNRSETSSALPQAGLWD